MSKLNNTIMFACNQGGHFSQMMALHDLFGEYDTVLVTDNVRANKQMKSLQYIGEIEYAMAMANKRKELAEKVKGNGRFAFFSAYIALFMECRRIWKKYRPSVIVSTGSNIAVPLFLYGKFKGSKLIFIETRAKVYSKTTTGTIVGKVADKIFVQWPEMKKFYPKAEYCGTLV